MSKLRKIQLVCAAIVAMFCANWASAFNTSIYATQSVLATGKWVKISIPESGVYEITYNELREMGFMNPGKVQVFGSGGNRISELLNGTAPDDLKRVPILRTNDKICFFGRGPVAFTLSDYLTTPHFTRIFNPYSQVGCYFLCEASQADLTPIRRATVTVSNYIDTPSSMGYYWHENELISITSSGKEMLGENISKDKLFIDYKLPRLTDSTIVVQTAIAANTSEMAYTSAAIHCGGAIDTTSYTASSSRIYAPSSYVSYNYSAPYGSVKLTHPAEEGTFEPFLRYTTSAGKSAMCRLDYFILTYKRLNVIEEEADNQLIMGYASTKGNERFQLPGASASTVVWYINNTSSPMLMATSAYNDESGSGLAFFANATSNALYVAFDPNKQLKKITGFTPVENQNLHGMAVPDLLIITPEGLKSEADRLADVHRAIDGIDVAVVVHDKIFNEFSSGTRDAMAYRLFCKMLYDRNPEKFKNMLLFGTGSFDNRELLGQHPLNLLTYQSDNSNNEEYSFTCDDFFGYLNDDSGSNLSNEKLTIGVGRMTSSTLEEAKSDVDKLIDYYATPDYGVWRNNTMVMSDTPDNGQYVFQGQGYKDLIDNELLTGMQVNTVHNPMYPRSTIEPTLSTQRKTATEAKSRIKYLLKDGAYFATYVGHAGAVSISKFNKMWTTSDVNRTNYNHWPIMTTACCDVAHYDNDSHGIAEVMFHKRDGGAIALLTSSRMVFASANDKLNRFFIKRFFSYASTGKRQTLGEAYQQAKSDFTTPDWNKMSFFLLGDPAIRINYPISRFNITSVNGTDMSDTINAELYPLSKFEVTAQVVDADGNLDTSFNGVATATLYDKERLFTTMTLSFNGVRETRDIYFDRPKLTEISGRVVNGQFKGTMIVPKAPQAYNENVQIRVYAHKDNSDYMVNGFTRQITMLPYDEDKLITDNVSPVITSMFLNDETTFTEGAMLAPSPILYITATDDQGLNVQANAVDNSMKLILDGGKQSFNEVTGYVTVSEGNKVVNIELPLSNLSEGYHTLTYTVFDMTGNSATRTISFMVGQNSLVELSCDKKPAFIDGIVNFDVETSLASAPEVLLRVTDATGKLVWKTTTSTFPVAWDMKDMDGNKVPAGLYRYFGTYNDGYNYGGTAINKLIVLDALKMANKD